VPVAVPAGVLTAAAAAKELATPTTGPVGAHARGDGGRVDRRVRECGGGARGGACGGANGCDGTNYVLTGGGSSMKGGDGRSQGGRSDAGGG
jgi:hypothetical protein